MVHDTIRLLRTWSRAHVHLGGAGERTARLLRAGRWRVSGLHQDFETTGSAPTRDSFAFRGAIGPALFFELGCGRGIYLNTDFGAETYVFRLRDSASGETSLTPSVTYRARAGVGKHW
jgi:hypothetical protein